MKLFHTHPSLSTESSFKVEPYPENKTAADVAKSINSSIRFSTSSWSEESALSNIGISTVHMVLTSMLADTVVGAFTDQDLLFSQLSNLRIHGHTRIHDRSNPTLADSSNNKLIK
ncbi:unnamed protein product [Diamesa serratosioi]